MISPYLLAKAKVIPMFSYPRMPCPRGTKANLMLWQNRRGDLYLKVYLRLDGYDLIEISLPKRIINRWFYRTGIKKMVCTNNIDIARIQYENFANFRPQIKKPKSLPKHLNTPPNSLPQSNNKAVPESQKMASNECNAELTTKKGLKNW